MDDQIEVAAKLSGYRGAARYSARARFLFAGVQLAGARVVDVGSGPGAFALWAALQGAESVLALEPQALGSSGGVFERLVSNIHAMGFADRVTASTLTLQEILTEGARFDVMIMYNVINHLDEESVVRLNHDDAAVDSYLALLQQVHRVIAPGGWLIVADAGRTNFWGGLGLRSPIARSIEWCKHQDPELWSDLFRRAGFRIYDLRWSYCYPFTRMTASRFVQLLVSSHFVLRMRA